MTSAQPEREAIELVLARLRQRARLRTSWLRELASRSPATAAGVQSALHVDRCLDDADSPFLEAEWLASAPSAAPTLIRLGEIEARLASDSPSRLAWLARVFRLQAVEVDFLHACVAQYADPTLSRVFSGISEDLDGPWVSEALVARVFARGRSLSLDPLSALRAFAIVERVESARSERPAFALDGWVGRWLEGSDQLDPLLAARAALVPSQPPLAHWPVREVLDELERQFARTPKPRLRVVVRGASGSGRRTFASHIAQVLELPLLALDFADSAGSELANLVARAERHAFLSCAALGWLEESARRRPCSPALPSYPLQFAFVSESAVLPPWAGFCDLEVTLPVAGIAERKRLWHAYVPSSASWPEPELERLAAVHATHVGELVDVAAAAPESAAAAERALRRTGRRNMGDLAERLESSFEWDDLVVPRGTRDELEALTFEAEARTRVFARPEALRLFPQGRGLVALFSGTPGTGKTMAAQVVARRLGVDLYRVNLATVVSKWVGETSKNLDRVLEQAARSDVILFFDEADALFGKRTQVQEAQDRFANSDTSYLLQAIESYPGVAVLASNRRSDMDVAFSRRIRYVIEFSPPDAGDRERIWRLVLAALLGEEHMARLARELETLAGSVELTGAQIKAAALHAVYAAERAQAALASAHLLYGVERELMKEGRTLPARHRERINGSLERELGRA